MMVAGREGSHGEVHDGRNVWLGVYFCVSSLGQRRRRKRRRRDRDRDDTQTDRQTHQNGNRKALSPIYSPSTSLTAAKPHFLKVPRPLKTAMRNQWGLFTLNLNNVSPLQRTLQVYLKKKKGIFRRFSCLK